MTRANAIDVSILVVSFNTRELTLAALNSVLAETRGVSYEIIVVDNASADGSAAAIAAHPARPRVIALDTNIGFARANNLAAAGAEGEYVLLLNPDTVILDNAIGRLVAAARSAPEAEIWGGRTLFADGTLNPSSCWHRMTVWNLFCRATGLTGLFPGTEVLNGEAYGGWPRDRRREVDVVSGCFLLTARKTWNRLGGFDPLFFMYGEEADLCLRARRLGARPLIVPEATIIHLGGASERTRADKMVKLLAAKASLISRHMKGQETRLALALLTLWPLSRWMACRAAAAVTRSPRLWEEAAVWREIWSRRAEWRHGYKNPETRPEPATRMEAAPANQ